MAAFTYRILIFLILLVGSFWAGRETGIGYISLLLLPPAFLAFILIEKALLKAPVSVIFCSIAGLLVGVVTGLFSVFPFRYILHNYSFNVLSFFVITLCGYAFMVVGAIRGQALTISSIKAFFSASKSKQDGLIVDANVIIDGRIADIVDVGFMGGPFILPQFVLQELQHIADSPDSVRRMRGRRAMEIVKKMQKITGIEISEEDFPSIKDVDSKLIALAHKRGAKIITNDYNLQKVAQIHGIATLNINELAKALKTLVMPGEELTVFIVKEGKEINQGVAYLEDGTMVVVENGRGLIGKTIQTEVTSVLQTTGGRMVFARPKDEQ